MFQVVVGGINVDFTARFAEDLIKVPVYTWFIINNGKEQLII